MEDYQRKLLKHTWPVEMTYEELKKRGIIKEREDELFKYILSKPDPDNPGDETYFWMLDKATGKMRNNDVLTWIDLVKDNVPE